MQAATIPSSSTALITCWPGTFTGCCGIRSWSFPKATLEPQKETDPTTIENMIGTKISSGIWLIEPSPRRCSSSRNSDQAISATAPPPTPL